MGCRIVKKRKEKDARQVNSESHLEKEDSQERELYVEKKIKIREQSVATFEKEN